MTLGLATGGADPRSANQTLGSGNDFDKDEFRLDLAYATLTPFPKGELPGIENGYLGIDGGKVKNPFVWKLLAIDNLLFDNDINPEGANLRIAGGAGPVLLFANGGVYVIDENAASKDPKFAGGQLGGSAKLADWASLGARGTLYHFFSLDDDFFARGAVQPRGSGRNRRQHHRRALAPERLDPDRREHRLRHAGAARVGPGDLLRDLCHQSLGAQFAARAHRGPRGRRLDGGRVRGRQGGAGPDRVRLLLRRGERVPVDVPR